MSRLVACFLLLLNTVALEARSIRFRAMWREDPATSMVIGWDQVSGTTPLFCYDEVDNGPKADVYKLKRKPDQVVHRGNQVSYIGQQRWRTLGP